jgi:hypothetical protein
MSTDDKHIVAILGMSMLFLVILSVIIIYNQECQNANNKCYDFSNITVYNMLLSFFIFGGIVAVICYAVKKQLKTN